MADSTVKKTLKVKKAQARPVSAPNTDEADSGLGEGSEAVTMPAEQVRVAPAKKPPYAYAAILALLATLSVVALLILQYVEWDTYDPMFPRAVQIAAPAAGR